MSTSVSQIITILCIKNKIMIQGSFQHCSSYVEDTCMTTFFDYERFGSMKLLTLTRSFHNLTITLKSTTEEDQKQTSITNVIASFFQQSISLLSVAIFQHHYATEFTFYNSYSRA